MQLVCHISKQKRRKEMKMVIPIGHNKICPIDDNRIDRRKSQNIPLPESHVHRTRSEVQLCEDMESAEQRDLNMFYRLVNGIRDRQMHLVRDNESSNAAAAYYDPAHGLTEAEQSLAHIIHTRNAPVAAASASKNITNITNNNNNRNNHANIHSFGLNTGIQQQQPQGGPASAAVASLVGNHQQQQHEWSVSGFDDISSSRSPKQRELQHMHQHQHQHHQPHQQHQQHQFSSNQPATAMAYSPSCMSQNFATAAALAVATSATSIPHTLQQQYHNFSSSSMTDGVDVDEGIFDFDL
jgi:hypothetical protein